MPKDKEPHSKGRAKQDSKLALQPSKIAPKKSVMGGNQPNSMYLPKNEPAPRAAAPAPAKKPTYKAPKAKQVFGNVNKMNARSKSVKRCK
jgi:hypothetical protein